MVLSTDPDEENSFAVAVHALKSKFPCDVNARSPTDQSVPRFTEVDASAGAIS